MSYQIKKISTKSKARLGVLSTFHGDIQTPFFMPVATQGTVKMISCDDMSNLGAEILLANTYHLLLRPGDEFIKDFGGLHTYMSWQKPILTDSGGYQIFSLAQGRNSTGQNLVKITDEGVYFKSYIDGKKYYLTPVDVFLIQKNIGVDIAVCLDECVALPSGKEYIEKSIKLTSAWAKETLAYRNQQQNERNPLLHCVIQGGLDKELRLKSLSDLMEINNQFEFGFDGFNIGGLSVGETSEEMYEVLDFLVPKMPSEKPRYLMGVGYPDNILEAVRMGVDMFDCVIPTREGRHGRLFLKNKEIMDFEQKDFYKTININNAQYINDKSVINENSVLSELRSLSKAYLHYLFKIKEPLGARLASLNNLEFYLDLMRQIREKIENGVL